MQDISRKPVHIRSMAWMDSIMYVVTNTTRMYMIDMDSRQVTLMRNIDAVSVAVDWLARRVYWSSANRQRVSFLRFDFFAFEFWKQPIDSI